MEFNTKYKRNHSKPEVGEGPLLVERAGYIPAIKRIKNMMMAGQMLAMSRSENYDFLDDASVDEDYYDPTREKSFDMAEAFQKSLEVNHRLKESKKAYLALKAAEAAKNTGAGENPAPAPETAPEP